jgi:hypothetical protein
MNHDRTDTNKYPKKQKYPFFLFESLKMQIKTDSTGIHLYLCCLDSLVLAREHKLINQCSLASTVFDNNLKNSSN